MANLVITLPNKLWWEIRHGYKMYELRKTFPKLSHIPCYVYVVLKGTHKVAGCFTIDSIITSNSFLSVWRDYGRKLCIDYKWYHEYLKRHSGVIHLWKIGAVYTFDDVVDLEEYFGIKRNPQSFVYIKKEPYLRRTLVKILDPEKNKLISPKMQMGKSKKDDIPF